MLSRKTFSSRLFIQIYGMLWLALFLFAFFAHLIWNHFGNEDFEENLLARTTGVAELLLPDADAPAGDLSTSLQSISDVLAFDVTVFSSEGQLLASTLPDIPQAPSTAINGEWLNLEWPSLWVTLLDDGRIVLVDLRQPKILSKDVAIGASLALLAVCIAAALYPITCRLVGRLQRLGDAVVAIGDGDLKARVAVEGDDEVAVLAKHINRSAQKLDDLMNSQRLLLANASHELRTPLARIRLGLEMLERRDAPQQLQALKDNIHELDNLIDDLIMMTRFEVDPSQSQFTQVDLLALAAEETVARGDVEITVSGDNLSVPGDARMLQHMLRNVVDNASLHGSAPIAITVKTTPEGALLRVQDAGQGIPDAIKTKVLEPFFRGSAQQNIPGYGLGLALVAKIASIHGAALKIENTPHSAIAFLFPNFVNNTHADQTAS